MLGWIARHETFALHEAEKLFRDLGKDLSREVYLGLRGVESVLRGKVPERNKLKIINLRYWPKSFMNE